MDTALQSSPRLLGKVLQIERAHRALQPDVQLGDVAFGHQIIGQGIHDLVGLELRQCLAAVPLPEASRPSQRPFGGRLACAAALGAVGRRRAALAGTACLARSSA